VVEGEGALEPVSGDVPGVPVAAGVVDEHVNPRQALEDLTGQSPYLGLGGQVCDEHVHLPAASRADLAGGSFGALPVPAGDREVRAQGGQAQGGRFADACGAASDDHCSADHRAYQAGWKILNRIYAQLR